MHSIAKRIADFWGPRCPDFDPECPTCDVWQMFDDVQRLEAENRKLTERLKHAESAIPVRGVQSSMGSQAGTISVPQVHVPISILAELQGRSASRMVVNPRLRAAWLVLIGKADAVVWE